MASLARVKFLIYSDYVCPYCFIGKEVLKRVRAELEEQGKELEVDWRPFLLRLDPPSRPPSEEHRDQMWRGVEGLAQAFAVGIRRPRRWVTSHLALQAAEYAKEQGLFEMFHEKIFDARFLEDADIGDPEFIMKVGVDLGLDGRGLFGAMMQRSYWEKVVRSRVEAQMRGIYGVPAFVTSRRTLIGAHRKEALLSAALETLLPG